MASTTTTTSTEEHALSVLQAAEDQRSRVEERVTSHDPVAANTQSGFSQNGEDQEDNQIEEASPNYPTGTKLAMLFSATLLSAVLVGLDIGVLSATVPSITNEFRTISDVGWYFSAYQLSVCSLQFLFGKIYTVFSIKVVFTTAIAVFEAGSLLCATAPKSSVLVLGRSIAGVGSSGMIAGAFVIITRSVPLQRRPIFGAFVGATELLLAVAGPVIGGGITDGWSWRGCFYINLPLGVLTMLIVLRFFEDPQRNENLSLPILEKLQRLDLAGTLFFTPSIVTLLLALQWGGINYGWGNVRIIALLLVFVLAFAVFALIQWRKKEMAILPPKIIRNRSVLAGMWFSGTTNASLSVVTYYIPIYVQAVKQQSAARAGVLLLPISGGFMLSAVVAGPATSLIGFYAPFMITTSVLTPIAAGLLTTLQLTTSLGRLLGYSALLGFGVGIGIQAPQVAVQTVLSQQDAPIGISAIVFAQNFGPTLFVSIAHTIFTQRLNSSLTGIPGLNVTSIESIGLADLRAKIREGDLERALFGYDKAIGQTFYLPLALACATILGSISMEWKSVKQKTS